jgi:hypothetical protein
MALLREWDGDGEREGEEEEGNKRERMTCGSTYVDSAVGLGQRATLAKINLKTTEKVVLHRF